MDIIKQLNWRYATKSFDSEKKVSDHDLSILIDAFNLTATSYGLQPIKLVVINDKAIQTQLVPLSFNQKQVQEASHVLVFCIDINMDNTFVLEYFDRVKSIRSTPDEILNPFKDFFTLRFCLEDESEQDCKITRNKSAVIKVDFFI